jgi:hypothetical protein
MSGLGPLFRRSNWDSLNFYAVALGILYSLDHKYAQGIEISARAL